MLIRCRPLKFISRHYSKICAKSCSKKDLSHPMQSTPAVSEIEDGWYEWWVSKNFFKREKSKEYFTMILPPPNVTGKLHMGHALTAAVQDALIRWNQMCGRHTVWVPGSDHAGIATQVVVERHLVETKNVTRHQIGREKFVREVEKWKEEKGMTINTQLRRMGVALDWERQTFTMDEKITTAVIEAVIRLFDSGLMYRENYMVNWCSALKSAISDSEVDHIQIEVPTLLTVPGFEEKVEFGRMFNVVYKIDDSDDVAIVSTTRPETIIGDTALMIHPSDERYRHFQAKFAINPITGSKLPFILDEKVDKNMGTGVVKVTPGHDFNDYEVGKRHCLPIIHILDDAGFIIYDHQDLKGLGRFAARKWILTHLSHIGQLESSKPHPMSLPICSRSGDVIEPRIKVQWFIKQAEMNRKALAAVENGELRLHPENYGRVWREFLQNERDWCVSRQLWWGLRIPIYWGSTRENSTFGNASEMGKSGGFVAAWCEREAREKLSVILGVDSRKIHSLVQETDVLDTWFSSALLPFASFGWPSSSSSNINAFIEQKIDINQNLKEKVDKNIETFDINNQDLNLNLEKVSTLSQNNNKNELNKFYPTSLLETGHDIIFFWVARMVMMAQQLTAKLPFKHVLMHSLICDSHGHKMSKSKGNALDPMDVINGTGHNLLSEAIPQCGSDSLRYSLCSYDIKQATISLDLRRIEQDTFFRNKIWQTFRFLNHNREKIPDGEKFMQIISKEALSHPMDRWILSELSALVSDAEYGFKNYNFCQVTNSFRTFWHHNLCDVYLEAIKPRLWGSEKDAESCYTALSTLYTCCDVGIRVLHPFMPFLTEELYQRLPSYTSKKESIMECDYPRIEFWDEFSDEHLRSLMKNTIETSATLRNLRKTYNITSKKQKGKGTILVEDEVTRQLIFSLKTELERISFLEKIDIVDNFTTDDLTVVAQSVIPGITAFIHLKGMFDPKIEVDRLGQKVSKLDKSLVRLEKKLNVRVPKEHDRNKMEEVLGELEKTKSLLSVVQKLL